MPLGDCSRVSALPSSAGEHSGCFQTVAVTTGAVVDAPASIEQPARRGNLCPGILCRFSLADKASISRYSLAYNIFYFIPVQAAN